jgi:hypothetical protein
MGNAKTKKLLRLFHQADISQSDGLVRDLSLSSCWRVYIVRHRVRMIQNQVVAMVAESPSHLHEHVLGYLLPPLPLQRLDHPFLDVESAAVCVPSTLTNHRSTVNLGAADL